MVKGLGSKFSIRFFFLFKNNNQPKSPVSLCRMTVHCLACVCACACMRMSVYLIKIQRQKQQYQQITDSHAAQVEVGGASHVRPQPNHQNG